MSRESKPSAPAPVPPPEGNSRRQGVVVPHQPRWYQRLAASLLVAGIRTLAATLRCEWQDRSGYFDSAPRGPVIYCLWHNRLGLCMPAYYSYARKRNPTPGMAGMVSASKDGAFLAAILQAFKVQPVRGSTSRRGPQALMELTGWAQNGYDLAITPDGPRGPRYVVQDGVMSLAQITGLPIIPFSYHVTWKLQVKSWDRFQIPLPFARCVLYVAKPIRVPRDASEPERERLRAELEQLLRQITRD